MLFTQTSSDHCRSRPLVAIPTDSNSSPKILAIDGGAAVATGSGVIRAHQDRARSLAPLPSATANRRTSAVTFSAEAELIPPSQLGLLHSSSTAAISTPVAAAVRRSSYNLGTSGGGGGSSGYHHRQRTYGTSGTTKTSAATNMLNNLMPNNDMYHRSGVNGYSSWSSWRGATSSSSNSSSSRIAYPSSSLSTNLRSRYFYRNKY